eukprot:TRINITY_DN40746_c0_g1_i1.p2 TRINITY_DN40746_c0_g1~~TRINITY_DN40746_c0_g1_i1.p2  ORF type:complete len:283 (+),score=36.29 TRINITY_DN40746_c0_g1_i1:440-1288(+)
MVANAQIAERRIKHASVVLRLTFATVLIANGLAAAHVINSFPVATAVSKDAIQETVFVSSLSKSDADASHQEKKCVVAQVKRNSSAKENAPEPKTAQDTNVKENAVMATALLVLRNVDDRSVGMGINAKLLVTIHHVTLVQKNLFTVAPAERKKSSSLVDKSILHALSNVKQNAQNPHSATTLHLFLINVILVLAPLVNKSVAWSFLVGISAKISVMTTYLMQMNSPLFHHIPPTFQSPLSRKSPAHLAKNLLKILALESMKPEHSLVARKFLSVQNSAQIH